MDAVEEHELVLVHNQSKLLYGESEVRCDREGNSGRRFPRALCFQTVSTCKQFLCLILLL